MVHVIHDGKGARVIRHVAKLKAREEGETAKRSDYDIRLWRTKLVLMHDCKPRWCIQTRNASHFDDVHLRTTTSRIPSYMEGKCAAHQSILWAYLLHSPSHLNITYDGINVLVPKEIFKNYFSATQPQAFTPPSTYFSRNYIPFLPFLFLLLWFPLVVIITIFFSF